MSVPFLLGTDSLRKIQSVRPDRLVSLWPQNEPLGHGVSTEIVRGYHGAYTNVTLGQTGLQGSGMTSAGYNGATSFNNIYSAEFANDNLMANPGFETAGGAPPIWANWADAVGDGALANEVGIIHEGVDSCKMTSGVTSNSYIYSAITVVAGGRHRLRFWTYGDGVNAGRYYVYDQDNGDFILPYGTTTGITAAAWGMVAYEFTAPVGCTTIRVHFQCAPVNLAVCYFDACEVRRVDGFLGDEGTIVVPARVANVGVWTDGLTKVVVRGGVDGNNYFNIKKDTANNSIGFGYTAGGVVVAQVTGGLANLDFAFYGITWDISAGATGEVRYYIRGVPSGAMDIGLGTWEGDLLNTSTTVGAGTIVGGNEWLGDIGPVAVWSTALPPDAMRYLGTP